MPPVRERARASYVATVDDPRIARTKTHNLLDIIIITICAVICGADDWVSVTEFGLSTQTWLRQFLDLPNRIPSHATLGRVVARINPEQFQQSVLQWIQAVQTVRADVLAIDGKTHRGSHDRPNGKAALHLISAWAAENRLAPGQIAVDDTSHERTAIPQVLDLRDLRGCTVTIDALGGPTAIAATIRDGQGHDVLALQANQTTLHADVQARCADARAAKQPEYGITGATETTSGHGRIETRTAYVISDPAVIADLNPGDRRRDLAGVALWWQRSAPPMGAPRPNGGTISWIRCAPRPR
jgi:hypothetical protein